MKVRISETVKATLVLLIFFLTAPAQSLVTAPAIELKDLKGQSFQLSDYRGKVVLVNFWATWCPPCRSEVPELVRWQRDYQNRGLQVVGITYPPQTRSEVARFTRRARVNYPVALGTKEIKTLFTASDTLPMTVVIDSEGNLRGEIEGVVFPEEFDQKIKPLLARQIVSPVITPIPAKPKAAKVQRATIMVNGRGYQPTIIRLRRGVRARLTFIRKVAESCGTEIVIPAYGINRPLPLNVPVVVSFTPTRSGRIKLTCGMDMFRGSLFVR